MTPTNPTDALTDGQYEVDDYGSIGEAARRICSFCEGDMRRLVYIIAKEELAATEARTQVLVEALEPFEKALGKRQLLCKDDESVTWSAITVGDLRKARQALATWRRT